MKRIAMLHSAGPNTVGGVETTIAHHAKVLSKMGYTVRIISGMPESAIKAIDRTLEAHTCSLFSATDPEVLRVKAKLDRAEVSESFHQLVGRVTKELEIALDACDICIAHNVLSMNKNLPLTAALAALHAKGSFKLIGWCHDIAWTNEHYGNQLYDVYPWRLLCTQWHNVTYVAISEPRREELAHLLNMPPESIHVVFPGIDHAAFFNWTPVTQHLEDQLHLLGADGLLLLPARISRRKNIVLALHILSQVRQQSGKDYRLIVTGPHSPADPAYVEELVVLRRDLLLERSAHFLYAYGENNSQLVIDEVTMSNLYQLADALLFPGTQEGFGLPLLEAGVAGLPIFCADTPILRNTGHNDVHYFDPLEAPTTIAAAMLSVLVTSAPARLRVRVRQDYRWGNIIRDQVVPLVESV